MNGKEREEREKEPKERTERTYPGDSPIRRGVRSREERWLNIPISNWRLCATRMVEFTFIWMLLPVNNRRYVVPSHIYPYFTPLRQCCLPSQNFWLVSLPLDRSYRILVCLYQRVLRPHSLPPLLPDSINVFSLEIPPEYGRLIDKHSTVVVSALLIIDDNCRGFYFIDPSRVAASSSLPCCTISVEL